MVFFTIWERLTLKTKDGPETRKKTIKSLGFYDFFTIWDQKPAFVPKFQQNLKNNCSKKIYAFFSIFLRFGRLQTEGLPVLKPPTPIQPVRLVALRLYVARQQESLSQLRPSERR